MDLEQRSQTTKTYKKYLQCYNIVNDLQNVAGVVLTSKILTML